MFDEKNIFGSPESGPNHGKRIVVNAAFQTYLSEIVELMITWGIGDRSPERSIDVLVKMTYVLNRPGVLPYLEQFNEAIFSGSSVTDVAIIERIFAIPGIEIAELELDENCDLGKHRYYVSSRENQPHAVVEASFENVMQQCFDDVQIRRISNAVDHCWATDSMTVVFVSKAQFKMTLERNSMLSEADSDITDALLYIFSSSTQMFMYIKHLIATVYCGFREVDGRPFYLRFKPKGRRALEPELFFIKKVYRHIDDSQFSDSIFALSSSRFHGHHPLTHHQIEGTSNSVLDLVRFSELDVHWQRLVYHIRGGGRSHN
jgi:hypothetical protein